MIVFPDRTMRKRVFGHVRTANAQISLRIAQSDQDLHCPLPELLDTTESMNGEQSPDDTLRMSRVS